MPMPTRASLRGLRSRVTTAIPGGAKDIARYGKKPVMIGGSAFLGGSMLMRRRRSGLDKTSGRPTGMYEY
jgi:hypothetical protein